MSGAQCFYAKFAMIHVLMSVPPPPPSSPAPPSTPPPEGDPKSGSPQQGEQGGVPVDERLKRSVELLKRQTGIKDKAIEGKTLEQQFDVLSFYADNLPKSNPNQNNPIVGTPIGQEPSKYTPKRDGDKWTLTIKGSEMYKPKER